MLRLIPNSFAWRLALSPWSRLIIHSQNVTCKFVRLAAINDLMEWKPTTKAQPLAELPSYFAAGCSRDAFEAEFEALVGTHRTELQNAWPKASASEAPRSEALQQSARFHSARGRGEASSRA